MRLLEAGLGVILLGVAVIGGIASLPTPWPIVLIVLGLFGFILIVAIAIEGDIKEKAQILANGESKGQIKALIDLWAMQLQSNANDRQERREREDVDSHGLSNVELKEEILEFCNVMRDFENNFHKEEYNRSLGQERSENPTARWERETGISMQRRLEYSNEFNKRFVGQAREYRDELLHRLDMMAPPQETHVIALNGWLAGPSPIGDLATYLEGLARKLSVG